MSKTAGSSSTSKGASAAIDGARVWRDTWGIPHIRAATESDAFAALGYVHAEDRLWQMEALLRRGTGRYAQWVGSAALKADTLARQLDTAGASQRDFAALSAPARNMLECYARGVNAFIAQGELPIEYTLLKTQPGIWLPWHSIAVMRQIGFLMGSVWWKLWRATALPIIGPEAISKLRYEDSGNELLCLPPGVERGPYLAMMNDLAPGISAMLAGSSPDASGGGSNNWALNARHTASGRPLLAGDPHRVLEMPNMYAQTHLACESFDVIGLTIPGVPGFPHFAHNGSVAWCVTHAFVDIHDLYLERFSADGNACLFKDQWEPVEHRIETIAVRGAADVSIKTVTTRHGPIVAGDPSSGRGLALRSMQFAPLDRSFDCLGPMLTAKNVAELYESTREWGLIDHNLVAADVEGNIGHRVRAKVPVRPRSNGWLPVPGWTGEHEWNGVIPFERMPACINPPGGKLVTANNRVVAEGDDYLCTDAMPPHRARRIWQQLATLKLADVEAMAMLHRDSLSQPAIEFRDRLASVEVSQAGALELWKSIQSWDGRMSADSLAASAYNSVRLALTRLVAERSGLAAVTRNPFAGVPPGTIAQNQLWWSVPGLLRNNDQTLLGGASWDELLREALAKAANESPQSWGSRHLPKFSHPLSPVFPEQAASLDRFSASVGGDNDTVFATGCVASIGARAVYASLARYVFDVGAWDNCRWVVFHGVSGNPNSEFYMNQNEAWSRGEMIPMMYDWSKIAAASSTAQNLSSGLWAKP